MIAASTVPVTAKIRTGWDEESVNYGEVGLLLQELGVPWVTMHGRTRAQKFSGQANWDRIADLVETLDIPVIGNGDVVDGDSYRRMVAHTRCHGGDDRPRRHRQPLDLRRDDGRRRGTPMVAAGVRRDVRGDDRFIRGEVIVNGEKAGAQSVRKHLAKCFKGQAGAGLLRKRIFAEATSAGMIAVIAEAATHGEPAFAGEGGQEA